MTAVDRPTRITPRELRRVTPASPLCPERATNPARRGPVLLATDGLGASDAPILTAARLAERIGVPLRVVTVLEPRPIYPGPGLVPMTTVDTAARGAREELVRRRLREVLGPDMEWELASRVGSISREIADRARQLGASVIVVGSAPRHGVRRGVAGELAVHVLRLASSPVLSVEPGTGDLPSSALVGVDFAPGSVRAAQAALLALSDAGRLVLLHVRPPLELDQPLGDAFDTGVARLFERMTADLRPWVPPGVAIETRTRTGRVAEQIALCADEIGADLVATGTHGPGVVERMFVGSSAARVLHTAGRTVLACPPPSAAESFRIALRMAGQAVTEREESWAEVLDGFTRRNAGRAATVEIDDPFVGAHVQARGYRFVGATYDRHDRRVELMLGADAGESRHLTRTIERVEAVSVTAGADGRDVALDVRDGGGGSTVVLF